MRFAIPLFALLASCGLVPQKPGEVVTCHEEWLCQGEESASTDKKFCTDPGDPERAKQIQQFENDFKSTCAGVPVTCNPGGFAATCQATCTPKGACDITTAQPVILQ